MTDFRATFHAGQEAAVRADLAKKEINKVFLEVSDQLREETNGKLEILRKKIDQPGLITVFSFGRDIRPQGIVARNPSAIEQGIRQLADWKQATAGYPCTISWNGVDHLCHDRESLESCLATLLGDAVVGEKLREVIAMSAK